MLVITDKEILRKIVDDSVPFFKPFPLSESIKQLIEQNKFSVSRELRNISGNVCEFKTDFTLINDTDYLDLSDLNIPKATKLTIIDIINRNIEFDDFKLVDFDFDIKRLYTDLNRFSIKFKFSKNNLKEEVEELSESLVKLFFKDIENDKVPFITSLELEDIISKIIEKNKSDITWIRNIKRYISSGNIILDERHMKGFEEALTNTLKHPSTNRGNVVERVIELISDTIEYQLNYGINKLVF